MDVDLSSEKPRKCHDPAILAKQLLLYIILRDNEPSSHLIDYLKKHFPVASFKSHLIQHDVH